MSVNPLYLDFFKFLDQFQEKDPWPTYQRLYLQPHDQFFGAYWQTFNHLDPEQIRERVRQIKEGDYSLLRGLIQSQDPVPLAEEALHRCESALPLFPEPAVYLVVGFFSADGVTLEVEGSPSIVLGMERFKTSRTFPSWYPMNTATASSVPSSRIFSHPENGRSSSSLWPRGFRCFLPRSLTQRSRCTGTSS